eukprot:Em0013g59a
MYHRQPRLPIDVEFLPNHSLEDENVDYFLSTMLQIKDEIKDKASANITKAQSQQKEYFDRRHFVEVCCISAMFIVMTSYQCSNSKRELIKVLLENTQQLQRKGEKLTERLFYGRGGLVLAMGAMWVVVAAARGAAGKVVVGALVSILLVPVIWLSFSPIPNYTAAFYSVTLQDVNMFSIVYSATAFFAGFASILVLDICGLKVALYFGASCNLAGSIIRWISTIPSILCFRDYHLAGYMVAMLGQTITAFAQPFLLYAPTKLASFWFGPKERAICTSIATIAAASFILTLVSFWYNQPTIPPAPTANTHSAALGDFFRGIWSEQSGLWAALTIFVGVTGAIIASLILDYTKLFKEVGVISFGLAVLCFVWFIEVSRLYDQSVNVVISLCVFGFFALPLVPVCMELGVEITYPVAEATSSGLLWSSVQISSVVLVLLSNILQTDLPEEQISRSTCHLEVLSVSSCIVANSTSPVDPTEHPKDMTNVMLVYMFLAAAVFLYMVLWFKPQYKRSDADRNNEVGPLEKLFDNIALVFGDINKA